MRHSLAFALAFAFAGCSGPAPAPAPVTGLVVAIHYNGDVANIDVSGAAEESGRRFGPWTLPSTTLTSGGTVGFIFDASDGGGAMICADSRDGNNNMLDQQCALFPVRADEVLTGALTLGSGSEHFH